MKYRTKEYKVSDLFDILGEDSKLTKSFMERNKGIFPVFSGKVKIDEPAGYIKNYAYDNEVIIWTTYGSSAGLMKIVKGKFSIGKNAAGLKLKNEFKNKVDFTWFRLKYQHSFLENRRVEKGQGRLPHTLVKNIPISIPIRKDKKIDITTQRKITKKYMTIKSIKTTIEEEIDKISNIAVDIRFPEEFIVLKIDDIFDLTQGTNKSKFTKEFVNNHKGDIPVYSTSKNPEETSYGFVKDNLPSIKYFQDALTWNIDGSVGKAFFRSGKFTLSEKVIPLILKERWRGLLDYEYIKFILEKKALEKGFEFSNKAGKTRIKDIEIEIPTIKDGTTAIPNIKTQKIISDKYKKVYESQNILIQYLQELNNSFVEI